MRVLVVDDDRETLNFFSLLLRRWGHEVRFLENPAHALSAALEFLPEIAFLDLAMPEVDGWEIAGQMRQHTALDNMLLVAVSGHGSAEDRAKSRAAEFDIHLMKPVEVSHLQAILKRPPHPPRSGSDLACYPPRRQPGWRQAQHE